jgi:hypothetical protein
MHQIEFPAYLKTNYPKQRFDLRVAPGMTGVDASVRGKSILPFKHAELKPFSSSGFKQFLHQLGNWGHADVALFMYDAAGKITFHGVW